MKINPVNQSNAIAQYLNAVQAKSDKAPARPEMATSDKVELSEGAKKYAEFLKEAKAHMERSEAQETEKAAEIMEKMKEKTYQVSSEDLARSILRGFPDYV